MRRKKNGEKRAKLSLASSLAMKLTFFFSNRTFNSRRSFRSIDQSMCVGGIIAGEEEKRKKGSRVVIDRCKCYCVSVGFELQQ